MIFEINTDKKTIKILNNESNFYEITKELKKLFPNGEWKEYNLIQNEKEIVYYPYVPTPMINPYIPEPYYPWNPTWIISSVDEGKTNGDYSVTCVIK